VILMKLYIFNCWDRNKAIQAIRDTENGYTVEIKKISTKRSLRQNKLYWLVITFFGRELGYTEKEEFEQIHDALKKRYLPTEQMFGEEVSSSSKNLPPDQFKEYLDKIYMFAASEYAITLPHPDDLF